MSAETLLAIAAALDVSVSNLRGATVRDSNQPDDAACCPSAPVGRVAIVFTDVQEATPLWERDPVGMRMALAEHHAVLRRMMRNFGGYEVKVEGDSFMIAFQDALAAVNMCLAGQSALLNAKWPSGFMSHPEAAEIRDGEGSLLFRGLRVRMGVHCGEAFAEIDVIHGRMDYFGPVVNRAARVMQAAHGGQVLVSSDLWRDVTDRIDAGCVDLGEVRLRGFSAPIQLVQVHPSFGARRTFPPPRGEGSLRSNLDAMRTSFVGRQREIEQIVAWLRAGVRWVTITGPGGVGKTRVARCAATTLWEAYRGGIWHIDFDTDTAVVPVMRRVAAALSVLLNGSASIDDQITAIARALTVRGSMLLIADTLDHLDEQAQCAFTRWLDLCPELQILATSRRRLWINGEQTYALSGLSPKDGTALLVDRLRESSPGLMLTERIARCAHEIVTRLDGIPLALELAASRAKLLGLEQVASRLDVQLSLLTSPGISGSPGRHATLRATLAWSFSLLEEYEKLALVQLARLPTSFDVATAEAIVGTSKHETLSALDVVQSLVDKSLLCATDTRDMSGGARLRLYHSVQSFALEQPCDIGERLMAWSAANVRQQYATWMRRPSASLLNGLILDLPSHRLALDLALSCDANAAIDIHQLIDGVLCREPGYSSALYRSMCDDALYDRLVEVCAAFPMLRGRAHFARYRFNRARGDLDAAARDADQLEANGEPAYLVLGIRSQLAEARVRYSEAWDYASAALRQVPSDSARERFWCVANLAVLSIFRGIGGSDAARSQVQELMRLALEVPTRLLDALGFEVALAIREGYLDDARRSCERRLRTAKAQGFRGAAAACIANLGQIHFQRRELEEAVVEFETARGEAEAIGDRSTVVAVSEMLGTIACIRHLDDDARKLWSGVDDLRAMNPGRAFCCDVKLALLERQTV